jgi:hypothetical protein
MQRDNVGRLFSAFTTSQTQGMNRIVDSSKVLTTNWDNLTVDERRGHVWNVVYHLAENSLFSIIATGYIRDLASAMFTDENDDEALRKGGYDTIMDNNQSLLNGLGYWGVLANFIVSSSRGDEWKNTLPILQEFTRVSDGAIAIAEIMPNVILGNDKWKDLSDSEKKTIIGTFPVDGMYKVYENLVQYADGKKNFLDAIMTWRNKNDKTRPKDDKIYKALFNKPYSSGSYKSSGSRGRPSGARSGGR